MRYWVLWCQVYLSRNFNVHYRGGGVFGSFGHQVIASGGIFSSGSFQQPFQLQPLNSCLLWLCVNMFFPSPVRAQIGDLYSALPKYSPGCDLWLPSGPSWDFQAHADRDCVRICKCLLKDRERTFQQALARALRRNWLYIQSGRNLLHMLKKKLPLVCRHFCQFYLEENVPAKMNSS